MVRSRSSYNLPRRPSFYSEKEKPFTHVLHLYPNKLERTITGTRKPFAVGHKSDQQNISYSFQSTSLSRLVKRSPSRGWSTIAARINLKRRSGVMECSALKFVCPLRRIFPQHEFHTYVCTSDRFKLVNLLPIYTEQVSVK